MSQAMRTRHFERGEKRVRSAKRAQSASTKKGGK